MGDDKGPSVNPRKDLADLLQKLGASVSDIEYLLAKSYMSRDAILRAMKDDRIFISPFNEDNLGTGQYDVSLGPYYFRENVNQGSVNVYNPYDEEHVQRVWGTQWHEAEIVGDWRLKTGYPPLKNIPDDARIIWLDPGETILAHTLEFIGGADHTITTMMKARSSMGRNFIEVCKCAGLGDIGYCNRWTMEITNNSRRYQIPLVVGRRMAQIVFFETEGIADRAANYTAGGKYQTTPDHQKMMDGWKPTAMQPRLYKEREIVALEQKLQK
ncbi:MAG: deoxycytidine triphosphate deaminase [Nanoarchaeota archaeon]|nr:deoxycytidine triphosphate deaminase [Nanoarchaeota archaeon]